MNTHPPDPSDLSYRPPHGGDRTIYVLVMMLVAACIAVIGGWIYRENRDNPVASPDEVTVNDLAIDQAPACDQLAGMPTAEIVGADGQGGGACNNAGSMQILISASYGCPDGTRLYWNDWGWGYSDAQWQPHARPDGQLVPPDQDMATCTQP